MAVNFTTNRIIRSLNIVNKCMYNVKINKTIFWPHFPKVENKPDFELYKRSFLREYETNHQVHICQLLSF